MKWEYCKVTLHKSNNRKSADISAAVLSEDGKHKELFSQEKGEDITGQLLARLGAAGWELVTATIALYTGNAFSDPGKNGELVWEYIFKRSVG